MIAFGAPSFGAETAVLGAQVTLAPQQRGGGQPERRRGSIDDVPGASANHLASGDAIVWTEPEPGREMRLGLPAHHVHADFADEGLGDADINAVDPGQVDAADAMKFMAQVKLRRVAARFTAPLGTRAPRCLRGRLG